MPGADTVFLISAIEFPESYDWQRDSAFGAVDCTLRLYSNGEPCLEMPAGPAARIGVAPDMHHFIYGSLYTEYSDASGTTVKRDGQALASWKDGEKLLGLLMRDDELHTLGVQKQGGALVYRVNGETELKVPGGIACGGFGTCGYGPTGALYEDSGQVCFGYFTRQGTAVNAVMVNGGIPEQLALLPNNPVLDIKQIAGEKIVLYNSARSTSVCVGGRSLTISIGGGVRWEDGTLVEYEGAPAVLGSYINGKRGLNAGVGWNRKCTEIGPGTGYLYCNGTHCAVLDPSIRPGFHFFHRGCACQLGKDLACVFSPPPGDGPAFMEYRDKRTEFNFHGYLTGISATIRE